MLDKKGRVWITSAVRPPAARVASLLLVACGLAGSRDRRGPSSFPRASEC
jgi:hypothetical protein